MLQVFRSFSSSKIGLIVTLVVLAVIAFAFAVADVANTGTFGGVTGGDRVAIVGDAKISTSDLSTNVSSDFERFRRDNPTATMEGFIAAGGMQNSLRQLLDRTALAEFGRQHGLRAGSRLVDSELVQIAAFHGADGKFDENAYRAVIAQQGLSDQMMRGDLATGLLARQVLLPVAMGGELPLPLVKRYAALLREHRKGTIGLMLSDAYAPKGDPTDAQLKSYYDAHRTDYLRPERRVLRYVTFGDKALGKLPAPTDAEIAERYKRDGVKYAASETRRLTQLVVPTKAAADAIAKEVGSGKTLDAAAREKGLATAQIGPVSKTDFAEQTSAAVAEAAFAAGQGTLAAPSRGSLGYYLIRVDGIDRKPARSLDQARSEIATALATEKRRTALSDLSGRIEDEIDNGSSLADIAKQLGAEVTSVPEVLADGQIYLKPGQSIPAALKPALSTAFDMQEGEPQLAEIKAGETFLVFDVGDITPSAAAPLPEIKDRVVAAWRKAEGAKAAKLAADRVMKLVQKGESVSAAMGKEKVSLPPPDPVAMDREQLARLGGRVPPVLALFFSMAEGTAKRLEAPNNNGWFVVKLDDIEARKLADDDPLVAQAHQQLSAAVEEEQAEQLVKAMSAEVGVERNQTAIKAVEAQLTGRNNRE